MLKVLCTATFVCLAFNVALADEAIKYVKGKPYSGEGYFGYTGVAMAQNRTGAWDKYPATAMCALDGGDAKYAAYAVVLEYSDGSGQDWFDFTEEYAPRKRRFKTKIAYSEEFAAGFWKAVCLNDKKYKHLYK